MDDVVKGLAETIYEVWRQRTRFTEHHPVFERLPESMKESWVDEAQAVLTYLTSKGWGPVGEMREALADTRQALDFNVSETKRLMDIICYTVETAELDKAREAIAMADAALTPKSP